MLFEKDNEENLRNCSYLYRALIRNRMMKPEKYQPSVYNELLSLKMAIMRNGCLFLHPYCTDPDYVSQKEKHEKIFKTVVYYYMGDVVVKKVFFTGWRHEDKTYNTNKFKYDLYHVYHLDCRTGVKNLVYLEKINHD